MKYFYPVLANLNVLALLIGIDNWATISAVVLSMVGLTVQAMGGYRDNNRRLG